MRHWWFHKWWALDRQEGALTLDACGGAAAYRRTMFVELGGFDPLYRPGYYEDLDLSYRAWARGWTVVYEPRSRAFHKTSASMLARYGDTGKARLLYRNHLLFTVKNIGGAGFLLGFLLTLPHPRRAAAVPRVSRAVLRVPSRAAVAAAGACAGGSARRRGGSNLSRFEHVIPLP